MSGRRNERREEALKNLKQFKGLVRLLEQAQAAKLQILRLSNVAGGVSDARG
jgi:hypothetical protein